MSLTHLRDRGYVYIVGAGPGDPGLFSLKGKLVLENADVVLVDHLVHPSLLSFCKENTEIVYVGKQRGKHSITQKGINDFLKSYTDQKKIVVRLKGGDPFVFGRVGEEMQWLVKHNIAFEIIPGISSAVAGPGYFGIPITHRDYSRSVGFVTGTLKKGKVPLEIPATDTIVFLMGYYGLDYLVTMLLKEKRFNLNTPIALISRATCADQHIISATLETICDVAEKTPIPTPVILVVGKVVDLHLVCDWVKNSPLFGKRVVLCRQKSQYEPWYNALQLAGAEVVYLNLLQTTINKIEVKKLTQSLLNSVTSLVFTSSNAVTSFFDCLKLNQLDIRKCSHLKIFSAGKSITATLQACGIQPDSQSDLGGVSGVIEKLPSSLNSEHVLYLTSDLAAVTLQEECEKRGARVTRLNIYKTLLNKVATPSFCKSDYIIVTSPSVLDSLLARDNTIDLATPLIVLGNTTKAYCKSLGFTTLYQSSEPSIEAIIKILVDLK